MKLGNKTFLYSVIIASIVGIVMFSYMIFLMPAMYMDYKEKQNLENARTSMEYFKKHGSLKNIEMKDSNLFGAVLPDRGYTIKITGNGFDGEMEFVSPSMKKLLDKLRAADRKDIEDGEGGKLFKELEPIIEKIILENTELTEKNFKVRIDGEESYSQFKAAKQKIHHFSNGVGMGEFTVQSKYSGASYTSFIGLSRKGENTLIMMNSVMTPTAKEILPVLYGSTPMLILLMILLAFGVSTIYSRKIVNPIKKLSMDAERRMYGSTDNLMPLEVKGEDEIADLMAALNLLYEKHAKAVNNLEEENKRKEVYMRATSHQLKTPIAASLLLVDGMIGNVGKFSNRDVYLPEVRFQLKEMMNIVEETSNINSVASSKEIEPVNTEGLCREIIGKYQINADSKVIDLQIEVNAKDIYWQSNSIMLKKILENLISNGINHTKENGIVKLIVEENEIKVLNYPGHIEEDIIENIFEPFVTSVENENSESKKGHGLGLYIAKYFAEKLDLEIRGENLEKGVQFVLQKRGRDD